MNGSEAAGLRGSLDQIKLIATGGMSQIFRARQPSLDRHIVIKKLKEELLGNHEAKERFRREAKALASVLHQNIAHVYDFVETPRESFILMEHIDGVDLSQVISKVGHIPPEVAVSVLLCVAKGVRYIHGHNLIHRDIKPSNIRLTARGEVKLMDFGIVMDVDNQSLTRPGMMVGSPHYLSPEQVIGDPITLRSDVFLLGICLYEMLAGVKPFQDEGSETVFQRIREGRYTSLRSVKPGLPVQLERIVKRCLQKSKDKRYASVTGLIFDLENYLGAQGSAHTEDLIVSFLDREALIEALISVDDLEEKEKPKKFKKVHWVLALAMVLLFLASLWGAFHYGKQTGIKTGIELKDRYGVPKPLKTTN